MESETEGSEPENPITRKDTLERILLALRYLSREAERAGLKELAKFLQEAELKCEKASGNT